MKFRDMNTKLVLLLLLAGILLGSYDAYLYEVNKHNNTHLAVLLEELALNNELATTGGRLLELVGLLKHPGAKEFKNLQEEIRVLQKKRRQILDALSLSLAQDRAERLEGQINFWLAQVIFNENSAERHSDKNSFGSRSDEVGRSMESFENEYRQEIEGELLRASAALQRNSGHILGFGGFTFLLGGLWLAYMIFGIWRPMRELQEYLYKESGSGQPEVISVTVPALARGVETLLSRFRKTAQAHNIVNSITEGLIIVSPDGKIRSANKSILTMLGYREDQLVGRDFADVYVKVKSVHAQGFFKRQETYKEEELFKTSGGKVIPVRFSSSFLFDEEMEVLGFVCIAKDITKEKKVEEELLKQNDWFEITLASIGDAVITADTEDKINFTNAIAVRLAGLRGNDGPGHRIDECLRLLEPVTRFPVSLQNAQSLMAREHHLPEEKLLIRPDGSEILIDLVHAPIRSNEGNLHGTVLIFRDITFTRQVAHELVEAKERAEAALRVKTQFLANMSHEIRTPMNGVVGMTDLLLDTELSPEQREVAIIMRNSGESLLTLLSDILDFSKIESGKLDLDDISFDVRHTVEEVGDLMGQRVQDKGLELVMLVHHNLPNRVKGDPGRIRQIILNLVSNAIKFTQTGEILIELQLLECNEQTCLLQGNIADTGIGIPADALDHLFDTFTQADDNTARKYGGTGLGLSICKEMCAAMGGKIWVTSKLGEGSVFSFTVRLEVDSDAAKLQTSAAELSGLRILLVENNENNRRALRYQLEHLGCIVGENKTLGEILECLTKAYLRGRPYHMVILDHHLPEGDLPAMVQSIKLDHRFDRIGILVSTSVPSQVEQTMKGWIDGHVTKPVKLEQLHHMIAATMDLLAKQPTTYEGQKDFRILLVEDDDVSQRVTVSLLKNGGYQCDIASNGEEALKAVNRTSYQVILMDCQMPVMDGFEATRQIRQLDDKNSACLPIIAMTANVLEGDRERCLQAGMNDYLSKPVHKKDLLNTLERYRSKAEN